MGFFEILILEIEILDFSRIEKRRFRKSRISISQNQDYDSKKSRFSILENQEFRFPKSRFRKKNKNVDFENQDCPM